jgi:hypothetical protein
MHDHEVMVVAQGAFHLCAPRLACPAQLGRAAIVLISSSQEHNFRYAMCST